MLPLLLLCLSGCGLKGDLYMPVSEEQVNKDQSADSQDEVQQPLSDQQATNEQSADSQGTSQQPLNTETTDQQATDANNGL